MELCGNCKHYCVAAFTGTTLCDLSKKEGIGYFTEPCEHYENNQEQPKTSTAMEQTTTTKVYIDGKELEAEVEASKHRIEICPHSIKGKSYSDLSLKDYTDQQLYDELTRRGRTGTLTRSETLGGEQ